MKTSLLSETDFQFIKELGSGSFGTVHLVKKINQNKLYAIKQVQLSKASQKQKDAALNQVRLLASIHIPYVIGYHGAFFNNNKQTLCILMQFADGGDLERMVVQLKDTTQKGFEETFIWKVAYEILSGLKILHRSKIIHRDIKSANIFFSNGIAKLGDLNVSKFAEQGMCQTQAGTPYFTSPQIWKGQKYTAKCDIWSTGCLLYEMCTLSLPFKGRDFPSLYRKVIIGNYEEIPARYSQNLKDLIRMCLTVDDEMRPSASELLETVVLRGMEENMDKFDSKGEVELIDAIKCPRVLNFLNSKLPKPLQKTERKKKTVNFGIKQNDKTQGFGFKINKPYQTRKIKTEKIINIPSIDQQQNSPSSKNIKNTSIQTNQHLSTIPFSQIHSDIHQTVKSPLTFSSKKLKQNTTFKRILSRKNIESIESNKMMPSLDLDQQDRACKDRNNILPPIIFSSKKINLAGQNNSEDKQNKKFY